MLQLIITENSLKTREREAYNIAESRKRITTTTSSTTGYWPTTAGHLPTKDNLNHCTYKLRIFANIFFHPHEPQHKFLSSKSIFTTAHNEVISVMDDYAAVATTATVITIVVIAIITAITVKSLNN